MIESLVSRVKGILRDYLPGITCAASLAHHRLLSSVWNMDLWNVDLTSVPAENLASLASSVTWCVYIRNVSGCVLVNILDSVNCKWLEIRHQSLGSEETQALVRAIESGVEELRLYGMVTLDIRGLMEYNGQGKCWEVACYTDTADRYKEQLRTWARSRNWEVTHDKNHCFVINRI